MNTFRFSTWIAASLLALAATTASADPPYDAAFDAPDSFDAAVGIDQYIDTDLTGTFGQPADDDFYRFHVIEGQDIAVDCVHHIATQEGYVVVPCIARLYDPDGNERDSIAGGSGPFVTRLRATNAKAGDWRFEVIGEDLTAHPVTYNAQLYFFAVRLTPKSGASPASDGGVGAASASGGGALGLPFSLLLGGAAFLRRVLRKSKRGSAAIALGIALAGCGGGTDISFKPAATGVPLQPDAPIAPVQSTTPVASAQPDAPVPPAQADEPDAPTQPDAGSGTSDGAAADDLAETGLQGQVPLADQIFGRSAQGYRRGTHLVGQNDLGGRGSNYQMATLGDCAYVGTGAAFVQGDAGVAVIDVADPRSPELVEVLESDVLNKTGPSLTTNEKRRILASGSVFGNVLEFYDASDCRHPVRVGSIDLGEGNATLGLRISDDGLTAYAAMCCKLHARIGVGQNSLLAIDLADLAHPRVIATFAAPLRSGPTGVAVDVPGSSPHADVAGVELSKDGMRAYLAVEGDHHDPNAVPGADVSKGGLMIVDVGDVQRRRASPQPRLVSELYWDPNPTNGITFTLRRLRIKGHPYLLVNDLDDQALDCPWVGARLIDIADEYHPRKASSIALEVNQLANCALTMPDDVAYGASLSGVDDEDDATMAFVSWEAAGLRVFDLRDPARPTEIAYYNPPAHPISSPALDGSDKFDRTVSSVHYDKTTRTIWFVSASNGFQTVELTDSAGPQ